MPSFGEIVERSLALLQRRGRVSHTALRLEFGLDDETLAALRAVRCGWEILRALEAAREVVEREFGLRLEARLAVATGATGNGAEAFGDVPRSAGTVQERSAADRLTVDAATREQAVAAFGFEPIADDLFAVAAPGCRDDHDGAAYAMSAATERLREHPHPQTEAAVQCAAATVAHVCGDQEGMLSASATALALATAVDLPDRRAFALGLHGPARVRAARPTPGSRSCAAPSPPRARPVRPRARRSCTGCWATRSPTGEPERALAALGEALRWVTAASAGMSPSFTGCARSCCWRSATCPAPSAAPAPRPRWRAACAPAPGSAAPPRRSRGCAGRRP